MKLLEPYSLGPLALKNRLVMAPMTRCRALNNLANGLIAEYYRQRSNAGLIVTEGISPSPNGLGYARIPGLFNQDQADTWRLVTDAVHEAGGKIFVQLMHTGRVSHLLNMPMGAEVLAPSGVPFGGNMWTDEQGELPCSQPREMTAGDIRKALDEFVQAATLAIAAGFDGVELHSANGYLLNQFLDPKANQRGDHYGGSIENRNRFVLEVAEAVAQTIGQKKTGIRLSPHGIFNDMSEYAELTVQYGELAAALGQIGLVYIHLVDQSALGMTKPAVATIEAIRGNFRTDGDGTIILNGGYARDSAEADLNGSLADLIAFGRPFIANPDLPQRFERGGEIAAPNQATFYTPGAEGYTDYPGAFA